MTTNIMRNENNLYDTIVCIGMTPDGKNLPLTFGPAATASVVLPAVANLALYAGIADDAGAETDYLITTLTPLLPTVQQVEEYDNRYSNTSLLQYPEWPHRQGGCLAC